MKSLYISQNITTHLSFYGNKISNTYEGIFDNPCRFYHELKKAFIEASIEPALRLTNAFI
jgi:hypothetical protein